MITVTMTTIESKTGMLSAVWTFDEDKKNPLFLLFLTILSSVGTQVNSTGVHVPFWRQRLSTIWEWLTARKINIFLGMSTKKSTYLVTDPFPISRNIE